MFSSIITWTGAMLGVAVFLAMAIGPVAIDFDRVRARGTHRRSRHEEHSTLG